MDRISVITGDSDLCPIDLGSYSSRVTLMMGHAAQEALRKTRAVIAAATAAHFNTNEKMQMLLNAQVTPEELAFFGDRIHHSQNYDAQIDFTHAVELAESLHGALVFAGDYRTTARGGDYRGGTIGASPAYSCTAHVADVSVDRQTGMIKIHKIFVAHDCGRAINPDLVRGQIEGSTYMGAAEVVLEQFVTDEDEGSRKGMLVATSLLDYRIPSSLDTPDIEALIVEEPDLNGPYGAKEAGEGPLHSAIPAVANAIFHAVGIRLTSLPFSPQKILQALHQREEGK